MQPTIKKLRFHNPSQGLYEVLDVDVSQFNGSKPRTDALVDLNKFLGRGDKMRDPITKADLFAKMDSDEKKKLVEKIVTPEKFECLSYFPDDMPICFCQLTSCCKLSLGDNCEYCAPNLEKLALEEKLWKNWQTSNVHDWVRTASLKGRKLDFKYKGDDEYEISKPTVHKLDIVCKYGSECSLHKKGVCRFSHPEPASKVSDDKSETDCKFGSDCNFLKNGNCKYRHSDAKTEINVVVCKFGDKCTYFQEGTCKYDHSKPSKSAKPSKSVTESVPRPKNERKTEAAPKPNTERKPKPKSEAAPKPAHKPAPKPKTASKFEKKENQAATDYDFLSD